MGVWDRGAGGEKSSRASPESGTARAEDQGEMADSVLRRARLAWCVHQRRARRLPALGGSRNAVGGEERQACREVVPDL